MSFLHGKEITRPEHRTKPDNTELDRKAYQLYWMTAAFYDIRQILTQLKPELSKKYYVNSIGLFGSIVRNDFSTDSDVDIIVEFSKPIGIEFIDLADYIEAKINRKVDLVSRKGVKPKYFQQIQAEIIYV